ncbi:MAG: Ig domain-containing protein [Deltaproteobacteria bacterium]|nr:Ig domain-containing protein [Deltaproteobacteria bacterium]
MKLGLLSVATATVFAFFTRDAHAQCPPTAPAFVFPGPAGGYSVAEGGAVTTTVMGGGPVFEWDTDCNGVTPSLGDTIGSNTFSFMARERDGASSHTLCVRSFNPTCAAASQFSAVVRTGVSVSNVAPVITTNLLPVGIATIAYSVRLNAQDPANPPLASMVRDPFTWSATGLPAGLSINAATGEISGTVLAAAVGTYSVTVRADDGDGGIASRDYRLTIGALSSVGGPGVCPAASAGVGVLVSVPEGGMSTVMGTLVGVVPTGCTCRVGWDRDCDGDLDEVDGTIGLSGVGLDGPSTQRLCVLSVATGGSCVSSASSAVQVRVNNVEPTITTSTLPSGTVSSGYVAIVEATDPANPPTAGGFLDAFTWSAAGLPPGLTINTATGVISGTPTMMGTFVVTVTVVDGDGGAGVRMLTIVIGGMAGGTCPVPTLTTAGSVSVPEGGNTMVTASFTGTTCGCSVEWDLDCDGMANGSGLTFNVSGVDRDGPSARRLCYRAIPSAISMCTTASASANREVNYTNVAPTITTVALPAGVVAVGYTAMLDASDPANPPIASMIRDPFTWSATGLPPGLMLNPATGAITGTPTMAGTFTVVVTVNDGDGGTDTQRFILVIGAGGGGTCPVPVLSVAGGINVDEGGSTSVSATVAAGICTCTVEWNLDCDVSIDGSGAMFAVSGVNRDGPSASALCFRAVPGVGSLCMPSAQSRREVGFRNVAPTITTASLPNAMVAVAYTATVSATDPANPPVAMVVRDPLVFSLIGAPAWLTINAMTGVLSGTPPSSSAGMSFTFTVTVDDGDGGRTSRMFTVMVAGSTGMDAGTDAAVEAGVDASLPDSNVSPDASVDVSTPSVDVAVDGAIDGAIDDVLAADAMELDGDNGDAMGVTPDADLAEGSVDDVTQSDGATSGDGAAQSDGGALDGARADGGAGVSGNGTCACRVPAQGPLGGQGMAPLGLLASLALVLSRRRARR